jgi:hypothetical protein
MLMFNRTKKVVMALPVMAIGFNELHKQKVAAKKEHAARVVELREAADDWAALGKKAEFDAFMKDVFGR